MAHDVFISYSTKDKPIADAVCATMEASGVRCWIAPRDIEPGEDWPAAITNAIVHSCAMVLVFSANSNSSEDVGREIMLAANSKKTIVPFKIENVEPEPGKQYYLARTHWLDAINPPTQEQINSLVRRVKAIISANEPAGVDARTSSEPQKGQLHPLPPPIPPGTRKKPARSRYRWMAVILAAVLCISMAAAAGLMWKQYAARPDDGILFADDFNDPAFDGSFDTGLWDYPSYYLHLTRITQEDGALVFRRSTSDAEEDGQVQTVGSWAFGEFTYVEARLKIEGQHTGENGNLNIGIVQMQPGLDDWYTTCGINLESPRPYLWCMQVSNGINYVYNKSFEYLDYDRWYTVRIQMDPESAEIQYYLDDRFLGRWQPVDAELVKDFRFIAVMGASASQGTAMTAYIDDVRIGK